MNYNYLDDIEHFQDSTPSPDDELDTYNEGVFDNTDEDGSTQPYEDGSDNADEVVSDNAGDNITTTSNGEGRSITTQPPTLDKENFCANLRDMVARHCPSGIEGFQNFSGNSSTNVFIKACLLACLFYLITHKEMSSLLMKNVTLVTNKNMSLVLTLLFFVLSFVILKLL